MPEDKRSTLPQAVSRLRGVGFKVSTLIGHNPRGRSYAYSLTPPGVWRERVLAYAAGKADGMPIRLAPDGERVLVTGHVGRVVAERLVEVLQEAARPPSVSAAQQHRDNGLQAIRHMFAIHPDHPGLPAPVTNVDTISGSVLALDLADGTTIRLTAERYPTSPTTPSQED